MAAPTLYTVGHSTRSLLELSDLLGSFRVRVLVDVRTIRRSRANPQFNEEELSRPGRLGEASYRVLPGLGGLRGRFPSGGLNEGWRAASFRNYADYALTPQFDAAFSELWELSRAQPCAVMCAEVLWWRCHRRIIADHYLARGGHVVHILGPGKSAQGTLTEFARVDRKGRVTYPAS